MLLRAFRDSLSGVHRILRIDPVDRIAVVEPGESPVLSGGQAGPHKIEGVGVGFTPPLFDPAVVDAFLRVAPAFRAIAEEEGSVAAGVRARAGGSSRPAC